MIAKWGALAGFWVLLIVGALVYRYGAKQVEIGAGYVAKEVCSCVYVGGREYQSCRLDVPEFMDLIDAEVLDDEQAVRAFVTGLGERVARYSDDGGGCTLY
jgi:hypothetical protein